MQKPLQNIALSLNPFGSSMMGWKNEEFGYSFGFNGQEKVDEINGLGNHNTALNWEYDTRLGRRWNLDPVIKEWRSGNDAFNNNPIKNIDVNGNDDIFYADGRFKERTKNGTSVKILVGKEEVLFSEFSKEKNHNQACAQIVKHYSKSAGINNSLVSKVGVSPSTKGVAQSTQEGIWVQTKGGASQIMDNYNDFVNVLVREKYHVKNGDTKVAKGKYTFEQHLAVYDQQLTDPTFENTSNGFKMIIAGNIASYLLGGLKKGEFFGSDIDIYIERCQYHPK